VEADRTICTITQPRAALVEDESEVKVAKDGDTE